MAPLDAQVSGDALNEVERVQRGHIANTRWICNCVTPAMGSRLLEDANGSCTTGSRWVASTYDTSTDPSTTLQSARIKSRSSSVLILKMPPTGGVHAAIDVCVLVNVVAVTVQTNKQGCAPAQACHMGLTYSLRTRLAQRPRIRQQQQHLALTTYSWENALSASLQSEAKPLVLAASLLSCFLPYLPRS